MKKKLGGILGRTALILMIAALAGCKSRQEEEKTSPNQLGADTAGDSFSVQSL